MAILTDAKITLRQLKKFIRDLPEEDEDGNDYEVWLSGPDGLTNICVEIATLNAGDIYYLWKKTS